MTQERDCETPGKPKKRAVLRRQAYVQAAESLTMVSTTETETAPSPVGVTIALFGFGLATSTIYQGALQESYLPVTWVTGPSALIPAVDSMEKGEFLQEPVLGKLDILM